MSNQSEHRCLSCGADISDKRKDAKYCSARCRMRYRRGQQKIELIQELAGLFNSLPNHSAQFTDPGFFLLQWNAISGKIQKWNISELKNMSNEELKKLIKKKKSKLYINGLFQIFSNSG
jgi:predicted nucleic acid-binding Zn ribbon protein